MNKERRIFSALLVVVILIASYIALFFQYEYKQAAAIKDLKYSGTPIIQPIPEELVRRAAYLSELNDLEEKGLSKELWFKEFKSLNEKYNDVSDYQTSIYSVYSANDLDLLFRVVQAEIGDGYSFEQKANVASVIFNRVKDGRFGGSLRETLNENQFSTISNGAIYKVSVEEKTILACEYAFMFGDTTGGALYFHSGQAKSSFSGRSYMWSDGAHHFY